MPYHQHFRAPTDMDAEELNTPARGSVWVFGTMALLICSAVALPVCAAVALVRLVIHML